jgi:hypothetical protein
VNRRPPQGDRRPGVLGRVRHHTVAREDEGSPVLQAATVLGHDDASLLDIVDNVLNKGVVISGDLTIALAQVDLIYARLSLLLCAADRILPSEDRDMLSRRHRRARRTRAAVRS